MIAHALIDALLGAANLGDIGSLFPSGDEQYRGASSLDLLWEAYREVRESGWELVNADCVFIGEEPRIGGVRDEMCERLAGALGVERGRVTVRATTTDGLGFTGRGEGLAAQAVACSDVRESRPLRGRSDLHEIRYDVFTGVTFPEYMKSNEPGGRYWGRFYTTFRISSSRSSTVTSCSPSCMRFPRRGTGPERPACGLGRRFLAWLDLETGEHGLMAIAICVGPEHQGQGRDPDDRGVPRTLEPAGSGATTPVRPTWKERYPLIAIERYIE